MDSKFSIHSLKMSQTTKVVVFAILAAALMLSSRLVKADENQDPTLVPAPVAKVFAPLGFDNNDDVEVILHGHFPNTCYKIGPVKAVVDQDNNTISIQAEALYYGRALCAQILVPFTQSVKLGALKQGEYKIIVPESPAAETTALIVAVAATPEADDFLYAPIDTAALSADPNGNVIVSLTGYYPYTFIGCMIVDHVQITETPGGVLVILPISVMTDGPACLPQRDTKKFEVKQAVKFPLSGNEYLLHVRTLNGSSVNRLVNLER